MAAPANKPFQPALIVVDMQNDFCPPDGSLAVSGARELAPMINDLLALPTFVLKVATQDFHPASHVSFASNHPPPNNMPFNSFIDLKHWRPGSEKETVKQRLWPVHCVQGTRGAEIIDELDKPKFDLIVQKGMDERVEMYSVFADAFGVTDCSQAGAVSHDLERILSDHKVSHVYVVGVAGDYCVRATALHAAAAGFETFVVQEGTACVNPADGWDDTVKDFNQNNVKIINLGAEEMKRLHIS